MASISAPFIKYPVATSLLMVGVLFVGLVAFPNLPVAPLPQIDFPTIQVTATLPGASPEIMASSVAQPLERQFAQIPGVAQTTSTSGLGLTTVVVQFDLDRNIDAAANDIQSAINAASGQLPRNLPSPPTYRKVNPADSPIMILSAVSEAMPLTEVDDNADTKLAQQISQISGVGQVSIGGEQKPSVRVQLDPAKLYAKGLSLEEVRTPLSITTVNSPKGSVDGDKRSFTIYSNDQLIDANDWNDVIVAYRDGAPLRVRDIGHAVAGPEDAKKAAWANGKRGVFLVVFKQPGANVIDTVDKIRQALPRLRAAMPASLHVDVLSDRTQTIRASVKDVEMTLLLTIALVVLVIFVFLRSLWATIIPSVTVPLALLGACALMYLSGYSLDNLSLMALTISVGFVVDDAIVVLENIVRHIEEGMSPYEASLKGSGEIGFTVLSISISLIAVFIPLLMMSGIIGRLFREFAVTVSMTIAVSAFVALTLTPMMASRFLKPETEAHHGRLYNITERGFDIMLAGYERMLAVAMRHRFLTLLVYFATLGLTIYLFMVIPKGFFPQQDTGLLTGISEAAQDISFADMMKKQEALGDIVASDPAVATVAMAIGAGGSTAAINNGRMYITLKPKDERDASAFQIISRLRPKLEKVEGAKLFLQAAQDVNVGGRAARTQFQYTLQDANIDELNTWAPKLLDKLKTLPMLRDVATDQQMSGTTLTIDINRDRAARFGLTPQQIDDTLYDAFGQRQVAQYFTQQNSYHVIMEILPELQGDPQNLDKIYVRAPTTGQLVPLATFATWTTKETKPLSISHQGQFPAVTISFNLAQGAALGTATEAIKQARARAEPPAVAADHVPGQRAGVPAVALNRADADRGGARRRLPDPRHPLRELHPPDHHPVDAAVGGSRSSDRADVVRVRFQPGCHDRRDPADRHRQEERHHARRLRARRRARGAPVHRGCDPQSGDPALPADHDDDHGCAARRRAADARHRHGRGDPAAARLRDGRRAAAQPGDDAVHDADHLHLPRQALEPVLRPRNARQHAERGRGAAGGIAARSARARHAHQSLGNGQLGSAQ